MTMKIGFTANGYAGENIHDKKAIFSVIIDKKVVKKLHEN